MKEEDFDEYLEKLLDEFKCISETLTDIAVNLEVANNLLMT